ncbi:MAG TPA: phosphotransferase, partial [Acidimicrobiales bacterium]
MSGAPSAGDPADDDAVVRAGLAAWLADRRGAGRVELTGWQRTSGGFSSDTLFVRATWPVSDRPVDHELVLRTAPRGPGTFADYDLSAQFAALRAAAGAGVPVADPVFEPDPTWIGRPFVLMRRVDGHVAGSVTLIDPWLTSLDESTRGRVARGLVDMLARIHRAVPPGPELVPHRDSGAELDH